MHRNAACSFTLNHWWLWMGGVESAFDRLQLCRCVWEPKRKGKMFLLVIVRLQDWQVCFVPYWELKHTHTHKLTNTPFNPLLRCQSFWIRPFWDWALHSTPSWKKSALHLPPNGVWLTAWLWGLMVYWENPSFPYFALSMHQALGTSMLK